MRRPLVPIAIALACGIVAGTNLDVRGLIFYISAASIPILYFATKKLAHRPWLGLAFVSAAAALYGAVASSHFNFDKPLPDDVLSYVDTDKLTITGIVAGSPERRLNGSRLYIDVEKISLAAGAYVPVHGRILLTILEGGENFHFGERVQFASELRSIAPSGNPGAFRIDRFYRDLGVGATAYLHGAGSVEVLQTGLGNPLTARIEKARMAVRAALDDLPYAPQREILQALTIGESGAIPEDVRTAFRDAGVSHILSISGLHVGIVVMTFFALAFHFFRLFPRVLLAFNSVKIAAAVSIFPAIGYCLMAGSMFSAVRSTIMVIVFLLAIVLDRQRDLISAIAMAVIVILVFRPSSLYNIGLQLSFAAVIGIVAFVPRAMAWRRDRLSPLEKVFPSRKQKAVDAIFGTVMTSISAGAATVPITAYYFNGFSTYGFILNLILVPLYSVFIIPASFFGMLAVAVSVRVAKAVFILTVYGINAGHYFTRLIDWFPGAYVRVGTPTIFEIAAAYGIMIAALFWKRGRAPKIAAGACAAVLLTVPIGWRIADRMDKELRFTVIDVGQGESQLIEAPGGKKILVDGGGRSSPGFDIGERIIAPFLWNRRIEGFDVVVSSHPDSDHFNGLPFILRNFRVGELWISGKPAQEDAAMYNQFLATAKERGIPILLVNNASKRWKDGLASLAIQWPPKSVIEENRMDENNSSLVTKLVFGSTSILMPADIQAEGERALLETNAAIAANVLVVPHHGGRTSSREEFLGAVKPQFAIISVGLHNRYHHPSPEVIARLQEAGAKIFRTDREGQVKCRSDAANVSCEPFRKNLSPR